MKNKESPFACQDVDDIYSWFALILPILIATYLRLSEDKRCDCPYTIHKEYWCNGLSIAGKMLLVTNLDLVNYLLCSKSPYTHEDLKAYKGLETYKRFIDEGI
ncbi:hypothetical protein OUZ56_016484 [Daphnia magna]|uniref:Uncharacterized protein n=1 Tax=Daphnia magna TaxID=35525 RepID=A0ABR0AQP0_9CRUS|nr:hypothetical protein OUZ56_016484 [Daphnia magna]